MVDRHSQILVNGQLDVIAIDWCHRVYGLHHKSHIVDIYRIGPLGSLQLCLICLLNSSLSNDISVFVGIILLLQLFQLFLIGAAHIPNEIEKYSLSG